MKYFQKWKHRICAVVSACAIAVTGTVSALSGSTVSAADLGLDNYAKLMQYSLYFFDANMCGSEVGEDSAFAWRDDCHTGDVCAGGFHDAGDTIKCGLPTGFTASTLGWMYYEYADAYQQTGTDEHFRVINDYFVDFMKESTTLSGSEVTSLVYQVGNTGNDHNKWCAPEVMYDRDASETYSTSSGASDVAAQYAAALALSYLNFGDPEDLEYATALYNFATKYRTVTYDNAQYTANNAQDLQDVISWAAGWLYLATQEDAYLTESNKYTSYQNNWTYDYFYGGVWLGAAIVNAEITGDWSRATSYIDSKVNANQNQFYVMNSWGSARHNTLMQICAMVCTKHEAESGKNYADWCKNQMNYILGDNNANVCLVVGYNDVSATSPHHRAASRLTISPDWSEYNNWNGKYSATDGYTLYGALCGGPTSSDFTTYNDDARDATSNEVALDYQVGLVGAATALYDYFGTGSVVAEIGDDVTVYPSEVAVANGEVPPVMTTTQPQTTTTEDTTSTTTEETTSTTEETTTTTEELTTTTEEVTTVEDTTTIATDTSSDPQTTTEVSASTETTTVTDATEPPVSSSETDASTSTETTAVIPSGVSTILGDVNLDRDVDLSDTILLNKRAVNIVSLEPQSEKNADCNVDGMVDGNDAMLLLQFNVQLVSHLGPQQ